MFTTYKLNLFLNTAFFLILLILISCRKESVFKYTSKPQVIVNGKDIRFVNTQVHFVKDTVYIIASDIIIKAGNSFTIDAGTLIKVNSGPITITIEAGGKIEAKGTSAEPIVFTVNAPKGRAGANYNWGGIRIYGNASIKNSGTLSFVRIEFAGSIDYSDVLLFSDVRDETTINNIQISYSKSTPSFNFSGGNCNAFNLVSYLSSGTDFILQKGYKGKLQNLLAYRYPSYANKISFLASNGTPPYFVPVYNDYLAGMFIGDTGTMPTISNLSVIGPDTTYTLNSIYTQGPPNERAALITGTGCKFYIANSLFFGSASKGYGKGFFLDNINTAKALNFGQSTFTHSILYHADTANIFYIAPGTYPPYIAQDFKSFMLQPQFNNIILLKASEAMLSDELYHYYGSAPNPFPNPGSPLLRGAAFTGPFADSFFKPVSNIGALGTEDWLKGWVNFIPLQTDYNY